MSNIKKDVTTRDPNPPYADDLNALFYQHRGQIAGNSNLGPLDPGDIASGNGGKKETSTGPGMPWKLILRAPKNTPSLM